VSNRSDRGPPDPYSFRAYLGRAVLCAALVLIFGIGIWAMAGG
jgi:hypothetical protein